MVIVICEMLANSTYLLLASINFYSVSEAQHYSGEAEGLIG